MVPQGSKIQSIISVAGHQVIRNLSEPLEFTLMHFDTYADYLRQVEPRTESRAVRALLSTGGPRKKKLHRRYVEVYGPYQVMLNVDGSSIYTRTYVTTDSDQIGQIYLGEEELKVRRIGHDAIMEQDAVHIGYEADVTAHLLDTNGKKIGVTGLLDTGAVMSVMPIKTWERMSFTREDLIPTNLRLAAANRGEIYVAGRTPITVLHMGGRDLWMSFLVVSVLWNILDTTVSTQRGKKLGYALPIRTDHEETQNLKRFSVKKCPYHANKDKILKRNNELKSNHKLFSLKSETNDGLSSCSCFPEHPSSYELETDKQVLPEIEHLKGKDAT